MQAYKPRVEDRTKTLTRARLRYDGCETDACIVDVSSRGLAATSDHPPKRGDFVQLDVGDNTLIGQVRWAVARRFGVALRDRISVISLLSGESGAVTLKQRETIRKKRVRAGKDGKAQGYRLEFVIFAIAGALGTLIVTDYVGDALQSLKVAEAAMSGETGR